MVCLVNQFQFFVNLHAPYVVCVVLFMSLIHLLRPSIALVFTRIIDAAERLQIQRNTFMGEQYLLCLDFGVKSLFHQVFPLIIPRRVK